MGLRTLVTPTRGAHGAAMRLEGKIAIITGGARGMGEAEARLFVSEGARVVVADVLDAEGGRVVDDLGDAAHYTHLDVTDEANWQAVAQETLQRFGEPDVLVNNAGILRGIGPIVDIDRADLDAVLDINLIGPILGMKVIGRRMIDGGGGSIINVSSTGGMIGYSMIGAYVASKWGLRGVTKSAAIELGPHGVRVNSLHPGGVATPMTGAHEPVMVEPPAPGSQESDPELVAADARSATQPIPRIGRPIEIARLALFLASDESSYCTGMEFVADGGATAGQDLTGAI
jgi:3alpha(or 20beta)-hydroxysteroid dehydrogenase